MRRAFVRALTELASRDRRIWLLTGDLGYNSIEPFVNRHPDRFLNVGVAEQNMVGVATGLAEAGFIPFCYSISTFATLRPFEFIRNGPVLHGLPVRIVGIGGGVEYGHNGPTHHGLEDVGAMRLLAGMEIFAPADARQAENMVVDTWDRPSPSYYRLGKNEDPVVPGLDGRFRVGEIEVVSEGSEVALLSLGAVSVEAAAAADELAAERIAVRHGVVSSVRPFNRESIADIAAGCRLIVTVEAHRSEGGLGSLVSEIVVETGLRTRVLRVGLDDYGSGRSGAQDYFYRKHGLDASGLAATIRRCLVTA